MTDSPLPVNFTKLAQRFLDGIKQCVALQLQMVDATDKGATLLMPYSDFIVGNTETGAVHGGAITSLMDQVCGMAVVCALAPQFEITPTIDLRIDHLRQSVAGQPIYAFAEAYRITKSVVFCRGVAWQNDKNEPLAHCSGTFMRMGLTNVPWKLRGSE